MRFSFSLSGFFGPGWILAFGGKVFLCNRASVPQPSGKCKKERQRLGLYLSPYVGKHYHLFLLGHDPDHFFNRAERISQSQTWAGYQIVHSATCHPVSFRVFESNVTPILYNFLESAAKGSVYSLLSICANAACAVSSRLNSNMYR